MRYSIHKDTRFMHDVIEWDTFNWARAIGFWEKELTFVPGDAFGLEIGSRRGGLSLYFAINGYKMLTTDLINPEHDARPLHQSYQIDERVKYDAIEGGQIPYKDHFDLITFKSVLGAICRNDRTDLLKSAIRNMHNALKPGGKLVFAENLHATSFHHVLRKRFVKWGSNWNYLRLNEILEALAPFDDVKFTTIGFVACFGRTEKQKRWLGRMDKIIEPLIPNKGRYILSVVATKGKH